jgi:hypothetical protein
VLFPEDERIEKTKRKMKNGAERPRRFFASWTGIEFFYSLNVKVTGAARLYRAASVLTDGLGSL